MKLNWNFRKGARGSGAVIWIHLWELQNASHRNKQFGLIGICCVHINTSPYTHTHAPPPPPTHTLPPFHTHFFSLADSLIVFSVHSCLTVRCLESKDPKEPLRLGLGNWVNQISGQFAQCNDLNGTGLTQFPNPNQLSSESLGGRSWGLCFQDTLDCMHTKCITFNRVLNTNTSWSLPTLLLHQVIIWQ